MADNVVNQQPEWHRHADLYFSDGSIVILTNTTLFKVYAQLLAAQSTILRDLIHPIVVDPTETHDNCPLMRLGDDPEDFTCFLKMIMGLSEPIANQPIPYAMASALLRLATKYRVASFQKAMTLHFKQIIPQSLAEVEKLPTLDKVFGDVDQPHPFELLSLFRTCGLSSFLPWTFYSICGLGLEKILQGDVYNNREVHLGEEEVKAALLGWKTLWQVTNEIRTATIRSSAASCEDVICYNSRVSWLWVKTFTTSTEALKQWKLFKGLEPNDPPALQGLAADEVYLLTSSRPCSLCAIHWLQREKTDRGDLWDKLKTVFPL